MPHDRYAARLERRFADIPPAVLTGPDPEPPPVVWLDVAVLLDATAPGPFVEATFDAIANRPLPLPRPDRTATRIDLVTCAGLVPRRKQYGHSLRLLDADQNLTVADAIELCAQVNPPPQVLVLVSDRAPTGDWHAAVAAWTLRVERCGGTPVCLALSWGEHLAELDGFAHNPRRVTSLGEFQRALATLWRRSDEGARVIPQLAGIRVCPPRVVRQRVLKPFPPEPAQTT
jgi:hypothetical protein